MELEESELIDIDHLRRAVREELTDSTALERASLAQALLLEIFNHVKFRSPEGGGLDGAAGPEQAGLGAIRDLATEHHDQLRDKGLALADGSQRLGTTSAWPESEPHQEPAGISARDEDRDQDQDLDEALTASQRREQMLRALDHLSDRMLMIPELYLVRIAQHLAAHGQRHGDEAGWEQLGAAWSLLVTLTETVPSAIGVEERWRRLDALPIVLEQE